MTVSATHQQHDTPRPDNMTHVQLTWIEKRIEHWIRFGRIAKDEILDRRRRIVSIRPGAVFAFVRWAANDFGTVSSRIDVVRAVSAGEPFTTLPFVLPGGDILLTIEGWPKVSQVLSHIEAVDNAGVERCKDDRHNFRIIVSPEDAAELTSLRDYTRDLVRQMEADLNSRLDWVAVDHWNTDNPHVHLLVRGVNDRGEDLVIARDYIGHGLRSRAEELAFAELGPKPEHEVQRALDREVAAERWTRLDYEIGRTADELGVIDLRPERPGPDDPRLRRLMIGRLQFLETTGLAAEREAGQWAVAEGAQAKLRELAARGDIIRTIGGALKDHGQDRPLDSYAVVTGTPEKPIAGRLIDKGLHNELTGSAYAVIDGTDGRTHHVRLPGIEALEHSPELGGIVELRAIERREGKEPMAFLATRSDLDLEAQVKATGATWLDHRLIERGAGIADTGFGAEVRRAMDARTDHLVVEKLARRFGERTVFERGLLDTLRRRELEAVGVKIAGETGLAYRPAQAGEKIVGVVRRRLTLASGRFAMIESLEGNGGLGFRLVPWSSGLESQLGREISGVVRSGGDLDLMMGRKRGLGR